MNSATKNHESTVVSEPDKSTALVDRYNVEFFHIYSDETIEDRHIQSINHLRELDEAWTFDYDRVVMIDNYNPKTHILEHETVLNYLAGKGVSPTFWVYEGDMVRNAHTLLDSLTNNKLQKSYRQYIAKNNKYPCSLLTASWYLTRLGRLDNSVLRSTDPDFVFTPATRLFNLLPADYRSVEERARRLIANSPYAADCDRIQHLFYTASAGRPVKLF